LLVQTLGERKGVYEASARQGLKSLGQIATLLLVASALAIAATLSAAIWQRRAHLATLKAQGFVRRQLWRALLIESAILLVCGSVLGGLLGILGHALASRWLQATTGFPAPFAFGGFDVLLVFAIVAGITLAVIALPGYSAAKVSPSRTYQW
jgi:putative ABC transport system permease protein